MKGVSPCSSEPIPQARGSGGCQPPTPQDGQARESAGGSAQQPEKRKSDEKEDKKVDYKSPSRPEIVYAKKGGAAFKKLGGSWW